MQGTLRNRLDQPGLDESLQADPLKLHKVLILLLQQECSYVACLHAAEVSHWHSERETKVAQHSARLFEDCPYMPSVVTACTARQPVLTADRSSRVSVFMQNELLAAAMAKAQDRPPRPPPRRSQPPRSPKKESAHFYADDTHMFPDADGDELSFEEVRPTLLRHLLSRLHPGMACSDTTNVLPRRR